MAIRLTAVDLVPLAAWCKQAITEGHTEAEIFVRPDGWIFRASGMPDHVIEPDSEPMTGDLS